MTTPAITPMGRSTLAADNLLAALTELIQRNGASPELQQELKEAVLHVVKACALMSGRDQAKTLMLVDMIVNPAAPPEALDSLARQVLGRLTDESTPAFN